MSRLFSHLENVGSERKGAHAPATPAGTATQASADAQAMKRTEVPSAGQVPSLHPPPMPGAAEKAGADIPASASMIPGYAIASQLSLSSGLELHAVPPRPTWPVKLWFLFLLALIGLSLAILLLPGRQPAATDAPTHDEAAAEEADPAAQARLPAPPEKPPAADAQSFATTPGTATTARPRVQHRETPPAAGAVSAPAAAPVPAAPENSQRCSEAMAAMNLCNTRIP